MMHYVRLQLNQILCKQNKQIISVSQNIFYDKHFKQNTYLSLFYLSVIFVLYVYGGCVCKMSNIIF